MPSARLSIVSLVVLFSSTQLAWAAAAPDSPDDLGDEGDESTESTESTEPAAAPAADASAGASVSLGGGTKDAKASSKGDAAASGEPWYKRHRPTRHQVELGAYAGILLPAKDHELYNPAETWQPYKKVAPDFGLRAGYYPLPLLGVELEGGIAPTKTATDGQGAVLGTFRGYGVVQLPYRLAPFALFGIGMIGTSGLGKDVDGAIHFGGGVKYYLNDRIALRLDVRDNVMRQVGIAAGRTNNLEILLGVSFVLRKKPPPDPDTDGDGFKDRVDACPKVPGVAPDGCPPPDRDGDGIPDAVDECPDVPETKNNYKDQDGCPDEIPKEVKKFTGVIEGIYFDTDQDTIKPTSRPTLDRATAVLTEFPEVKVEISGHTDTDGDRDHNTDLSRRRAEAVRKYLLDAGIDPSRITTRGAGPDEPIATNETAEGKAKNRRIEFKLIE